MGDVPIRVGLFFFERFRVLPVDHVEVPLCRQAVPVFDHLRDLVVGVDVHERDRHMAEEGFSGKPEQHGGILADRPQHAQVAQLAVCFPQDVDAFVFQYV